MMMMSNMTVTNKNYFTFFCIIIPLAFKELINNESHELVKVLLFYRFYMSIFGNPWKKFLTNNTK